ncbi:hypothetical protein BX265_6167 [Streptomyces sp. TLI_235]|nr:hypothetical protein [Streptomyces sp. TLI_235]PBC71557.1 hypothetical protein BX265_6167 [Streptomyces sp. TLI_235]
MKLVLLLAVLVVTAYAIAYRLADAPRREGLKWAAFHLAWITVIATLVAAWRN